jgi:hypothetical protein
MINKEQRAVYKLSGAVQLCRVTSLLTGFPGLGFVALVNSRLGRQQGGVKD